MAGQLVSTVDYFLSSPAQVFFLSSHVTSHSVLYQQQSPRFYVISLFLCPNVGSYSLKCALELTTSICLVISQMVLFLTSSVGMLSLVSRVGKCLQYLTIHGQFNLYINYNKSIYRNILLIDRVQTETCVQKDIQ